MQKPCYIYFDGRDELLDVDGEMERYPLGQLIFSILDIDWAACGDLAEGLQKRLSAEKERTPRTIQEGFDRPQDAPYCMVGELYHSLMRLFKYDHPSLHRLFSAQNVIKTLTQYEAAYDTAERSPDRFGAVRRTGNLLIAANFTTMLLDAYPNPPELLGDFGELDDGEVVTIALQFLDHLAHSLRRLDSFQKRLAELLHFALDTEGTHSDRKPVQRRNLMESAPFEPYQKCLPLYETIRIKRRIFEGESAATFYSSDDICALALLEFEHFCNHNLPVRRCGHCHRYFLPHTQHTRYCDRIADPDRGRTCKDVASMAKYLDAIREDEAKRLYRRYANAYQMRCSRAPECYKRADYETWKDEAKAHMERYKRGEIDLVQYEELIRIPERR